MPTLLLDSLRLLILTASLRAGWKIIFKFGKLINFNEKFGLNDFSSVFEFIKAYRYKQKKLK